MRYLFFLILLALPSLIDAWSLFKNTLEPAQPVSAQVCPITIMIDPAGDIRNPGREIEDTFERGITLQCAQDLKKLLEANSNGIRVILTRVAGDTIEQFQNANFSNRLQADVYISLHFYQAKTAYQRIYVYHMLYNPITDFWGKKEDDLVLQPYNQAYRANIKKTRKLATIVVNSLKKAEKQYKFICQGLFGIPFKPLVGIVAPAFALEISLNKKDDWKNIISPLAQAIAELINTIQEASNYDTHN
jgi:N-acetylmuramoyl-L-alanine amidase